MKYLLMVFVFSSFATLEYAKAAEKCNYNKMIFLQTGLQPYKGPLPAAPSSIEFAKKKALVVLTVSPLATDSCSYLPTERGLILYDCGQIEDTVFTADAYCGVLTSPLGIFHGGE